MSAALEEEIAQDDAPAKESTPRSGKDSEAEANQAESSRLVRSQEDADAAALRQSTQLASAKLITILWKREGQVIDVEKTSVYGSSLLLPQVARSAGWPRELVFLVIRSYILLFLAVFLQGFMVYMINKEEAVLDKFSGESYLCDMGRNLPECPDGPGCMGPGGTRYTPSRLYGWSSYVARSYAKQSLQAMFPDKADLIDEKVDPGEYGVESHWCRLLGCFLFVTSLTSEILAIGNFAKFLIYLPTESKSWISYEHPLEEHEKDKEQAKKTLGMSELDCVKIRVCGMPLGWKAANVVLLLIPKVAVWMITLIGGVTFLMETAGIDDCIVNSTALAFILNIDEMIYESLTNNFTRAVMQNAEAYELVDGSVDENYTDAEALAAFERTRLRSNIKFVAGLFPYRVILTLGFTALGVGFYYHKNCLKSSDGTWVSKSMYLPLDDEYTVFEAFLPMWFSPAHKSKPYWTYSE